MTICMREGKVVPREESICFTELRWNYYYYHFMSVMMFGPACIRLDDVSFSTKLMWREIRNFMVPRPQSKTLECRLEEEFPRISIFSSPLIPWCRRRCPRVHGHPYSGNTWNYSIIYKIVKVKSTPVQNDLNGILATVQLGIT